MREFDTCKFAFDGKFNILEEKDIGISADIASMLTPFGSVSAMKCFQACPYTNTAFDFNVILDGEKIKSDGWKWLPNAIKRWGETKLFSVETITAVVPASRSVIQKITVRSKATCEITVPVSVAFRGKSRKEENWEFMFPSPEPLGRLTYELKNNILSLANNGTAFRLTSSLEGMRLFGRAYLWENEITVKKNEETVFYFSAHLGDENESFKEAESTQGRYEELIALSFDYLNKEVRRIEENLPTLKSDCEDLDRLYYRSLVSYILCRWENPLLCTSPFFSNGGVNGACMCSYLWDYAGGLMLHPLYDVEGNKAQMKAYLRNDLTKSFALNPVTSGPVGPWYPINQEKIILMVYYHILNTKDRDFLFETVGDMTVLEWMKYHAYVGDDLSGEVKLFDYGTAGDAHLELHHRGNGPYNGIMPDLNARRYLNYTRVYELTKLAGEPDETLLLRAEGLKKELKTLWNKDTKWYDFIDADKNRDSRYTVQMYKFLNSPVIDREEREGLISHLNDEEFLSKFGLHSLSKLDPQYDQDDIDNGGGGLCPLFAMQTISQLYETGYDELATDILRRVYWWGERVPYMGDSFAANMILNREDTPLQGDINSISCSQMIFFYIFGITPHFDGKITISPVKHRPCENLKVTNARLCNKAFSVDVRGDHFTVSIDGKDVTAKIGQTVEI